MAVLIEYKNDKWFIIRRLGFASLIVPYLSLIQNNEVYTTYILTYELC